MRKLLSEPHVRLLDEPFNKLDAQLRQNFRRFVFEQAAERELPTQLVTHTPPTRRRRARLYRFSTANAQSLMHSLFVGAYIAEISDTKGATHGHF
jgi:ABC-type uncharacterized transport system YnjBCD ATPase subunit